MTSKDIPRLSISASSSAACFFQSGVSRIAESGFPTLCLGRIIRCQRPADALVHHSEAVVREGLIIHRTPYEKAGGRYTAGFFLRLPARISGAIAI
jgi:hypothetical protein